MNLRILYEPQKLIWISECTHLTSIGSWQLYVLAFGEKDWGNTEMEYPVSIRNVIYGMPPRGMWVMTADAP